MNLRNEMNLNFIKILDLDLEYFFFCCFVKICSLLLESFFFAEYTLIEGGFYLSATMSWVLLCFQWDTCQ